MIQYLYRIPFSFLILIFSYQILFFACTEESPQIDPRDQITKCKDDNFCQSFEVCLSGNCVAAKSKGCLLDQDCDQEQQCDSVLNICRSENEDFACDSTSNCPFGFICLEKICRKTSDLKFCNSNEDCSEDSFCLTAKNTCIERAKCNSNIDCPEGLVCDQKEESCREKDEIADCKESDSSTCPLGQFCFEGQCLECQKNSDCPEGLECKKEINACLGISSCGSDNECNKDYYCDSSLFQCVPKKRPCIVDLDCPVGFICPSDEKVCKLSEGKCENDNLEPNETYQKASRLKNGFNTSLELCKNDQDWFKIELSTGNLAVINAKTEENVFGLIAELFDEQQKLLDKQSFSATEDINIKFFAETKKTYYLKMTAEAGKTIRYNIEKKIYTGIVKTLDKFEPNNNLSEVKKLSFGRYSNLNLHPVDIDFFSIKASQKDRKIRVDLIGNSAKKSIDLTIYKPDQSSVYKISSGKSSSRSLSVDPLTYGDTNKDVVFSISGEITDYEIILTEN